MSSAVIVWFGTAVGMALISTLWALLSKRRNARMHPVGAATVDAPAGQGLLTVTRPHAGLGGAARSFKVLVNGDESGKLKAGGIMEIPLPVGRHTVQLAIGRIRSDLLHFDVVAGQRCAFESEIVPTALSSRLELRPIAVSGSPVVGV